MRVRQRYTILVAVFVIGLLGPSSRISIAQSTGCENPLPPDPTKTFFQNFLNNCYAVGLPAAKGQGNGMTDLDQTYAGIFYRPNPNYELILVGEYPRARYHSITVDDAHFLAVGSFHDAQIAPLTAQFVNPFVPGVQYAEDQLYTVAVSFGGTQPAATNVLPGCDLGGLDIHRNVIDATRRHADVSWNGDPRVPTGFPLHDDTGPNRGGLLTIRQYMNEEDLGRFKMAVPLIIARNLTTGCAVPARDVIAETLETVTPDHLLTRTEDIAARWVSLPQIRAHKDYRAMHAPMCYRYTPAPGLWFKPERYLELANPQAGYVLAPLPRAHISWLAANREFLRLRFRLPSMATIPCQGCSLSGTEDLRYFSLSFFDNQSHTLASLGEFELVRDPNGYVTIIVGFGNPPPAAVTPQNYYTYFDLSTIENFENLSTLAVRMILPSDKFPCSPAMVPDFTSEDHSLGGFMGEYAPIVDPIRGSQIPSVATPLQHPDSCGLVPPEPAEVCRF